MLYGTASDVGRTLSGPPLTGGPDKARPTRVVLNGVCKGRDSTPVAGGEPDRDEVRLTSLR